MKKVKALYTLGGCINGESKISVSKDKEYELHEEGYIVDNYGERLNLTKEEINYRFAEVKI
jgi:hypothetical protein